VYLYFPATLVFSQTAQRQFHCPSRFDLPLRLDFHHIPSVGGESDFRLENSTRDGNEHPFEPAIISCKDALKKFPMMGRRYAIAWFERASLIFEVAS
jgi:hypothetical protein